MYDKQWSLLCVLCVKLCNFGIFEHLQIIGSCNDLDNFNHIELYGSCIPVGKETMQWHLLFRSDIGMLTLSWCYPPQPASSNFSTSLSSTHGYSYILLFWHVTGEWEPYLSFLPSLTRGTWPLLQQLGPSLHLEYSVLPVTEIIHVGK